MIQVPDENSALSVWLDYIAHVHDAKIDLGLERIGIVAKRLALGVFDCPVITVAGTNGKGSTVKLLESIYLAAGYRVATYTSPHLHHYTERFQINGVSVKAEHLPPLFDKIERARKGISLSYFEFSALLAFLLFQQTPLDIIILEVGLGGRLDAVNMIDPDIAMISSIGIDHVEWLGPDRESIGREKAGIFRAHKPAICADPHPPSSIAQTAKVCGAHLYQLGRDFHFQVQEDTFNWQGIKHRYEALSLPGLKIENLVGSLMAVELLATRLPVTQKAIKQAISTAHLPGRFQMIAHAGVGYILDVAHNPQATEVLAKRLQIFKNSRLLAVVGMLEDKDIAKTLAPLLPLVEQWNIANLNVSRGAKADEILNQLATHTQKSCYTFASVEEAMQAAAESVHSNAVSLGASPQGACEEDIVQQTSRVLVFGSFYTVAAAQSWLHHE